ncbi:unnamed protein product, partial [marine sediment metagenome]
MEEPNKKTVQFAAYILNHYDRNSHKDHLVLAKNLERWAVKFVRNQPACPNCGGKNFDIVFGNKICPSCS